MTAIITLAIALPTLAVWMRAAYLVETYGRQLRSALAAARRSALAAARRDAEHAAADPAPLEIDPRTVASVRGLRLVHLHEHHEQLVDAAVRRHPQMSPRDEETVPPAQADPLPAPGCTSRP